MNGVGGGHKRSVHDIETVLSNKKELLIPVATRMDLKNIMLCERILTQEYHSFYMKFQNRSNVSLVEKIKTVVA